MIGFQKQLISIEIFNDATIILEPVILKEDTLDIDEIVIVGKKNVIEFEAGKTVVVPNASILTSKGNTLEVLKSIPGLIVNDDGTIFLNGEKGVNVQVNGKDTYLSGIALANLLKSTAATSVEKIEILTSPSAEYDASGKAGVINIRLKKLTIQGITFASSINYQQGNDGRSDIWVRTTFRKKKVGFSVDYFHYQGDKAKKGIISREYLPLGNNTNSAIKTADQTVALTNKDNTDNVKFVADFDLTKRITLVTYLGSNFFHRSIPGVSYTTFSEINSPVDSVLKTITFSDYRQTTINSSIQAAYKNENNLEVNASMDYLLFSHIENTLMSSELSHTSAMPFRTDSLWGDLDGDIKIFSTDNNLLLPLGNNMKIQAGSKISCVYIDNSAIYTNPFESQIVTNYNYSSKYAYNENINAAYVQFNGKIRKWGVQAGLRVENTRISGVTFDIKEAGQDSSYGTNYSNIFPNVSLLYTKNDNQNLSLVYNRRITRPNYRDLSPFDYMVDEYTVSRGNPELKAELTHHLELAYVFRKIFRTSLYYTITNNAISTGFKELENGGLLIIPENLALNKHIGLKLDAGRLIDLKWWQMNAGISTFYTENKWIDININKTNTQITPLLNCNNQFFFAKGWSAQLTGYYNGKMSLGQMKIPAGWSASAGIRKKLLNDKLHVHLYGNDIFASIRERATFEGGSIRGYSDVRFDETSVGISIYYNFKNGQQKESREKTLEESKRINF